MRKKWPFMVFIMVFLLSATLIIGFPSYEDEDAFNDKIRAYYDNQVIQTETGYTVTALDDISVAGVTSIQVLNGKLYLLNKLQNCITVLDSNGNFLSQIGSIGNEEGSLLAPTAFSFTEDYLIVGDSGNQRLQLFDLSGASKGTIPLSMDSEYSTIKSIMRVEDGFLLSVTPGANRNAYTVIYLSDEGTQKGLMRNVSGFFTRAEDKVTFVEDAEFYTHSTGFGYRTGKGNVWTWNGEAFAVVHTLPYGYDITGEVAYHNEKLFAYSRSVKSIDVFNTNWDYQQTIRMIQGDIPNIMDGNGRGACFAMDGSSNTFFICLPLLGLYRFSPTASAL